MTPIRIVIAKPGLDGHDRGAKVIARALRDAGMEVIYTGLRQSTEQITAAVIQEDAKVLGLSILSGAHRVLIPKIIAQIKEQVSDKILIFVGGIIPEEDIPYLKEQGVDEVFLPGTSTEDVILFIHKYFEARGKS